MILLLSAKVMIYCKKYAERQLLKGLNHSLQI